MWNGIDFTAKAELIDQLQKGKHTITPHFLLTHKHKQSPQEVQLSCVDGTFQSGTLSMLR